MKNEKYILVKVVKEYDFNFLPYGVALTPPSSLKELWMYIRDKFNFNTDDYKTRLHRCFKDKSLHMFLYKHKTDPLFQSLAGYAILKADSKYIVNKEVKNENT